MIDKLLEKNLLPDAVIAAVDLHPPFVEDARRRAAEAGLADRIRMRVPTRLFSRISRHSSSSA